MSGKALVWTGTAIILATLGILITWAALSGYLPRIEFQPAGIAFTPPHLDIRSFNLANILIRIAVAPLKLFAGALQVTLGQFADAFRLP